MIALTQELHELFRRTLDGLGEMSRLLEEEARCLAARDAAALEAVASKKQTLASVLNEVAVRQDGVVRVAAPVAAGRMTALLDRLDSEHPLAETLRSDWLEIVRLGAECRKRNELNGAYLGLLQRHVDSSLNFFHGVASPDATYGPDGATHRGEISRRSFSV
ncbi:FlgN family protein [Methylocaldum marinum]|uniref:FlgN family protein n=1 Tax=Methylocaldum marinum TaxID=1432792 RepID=A0A250KLK4_9GAMM|nr:flagellar protein FlgN [Methylocaldum marinum]BBA32610.1 FlgN family protein [Methylocaldum marinum]